MLKNYSAVKLQSFYKKFIKCDRDDEEISKIKVVVCNNGKSRNRIKKIKSPIDPIYRIPYDEKYRIRIIEKPYGERRYNVWHFNINSLIEWLNVAKEWINPMTNCLFLNKTQDNIFDFIEHNRTKRKLRIKKIYNRNEKGYRKKKYNPVSYVSTGIDKLSMLLKYVKESDEKNCFNFLEKNYQLIEDNKLDLDSDINETIFLDNFSSSINPVGLLHLAVAGGNKSIVSQLIYYGCNINKKCGDYGFNVMHLCAILDNIGMAKLLLQFGMTLDDVCVIDDDFCSVFEICEILQHYDFLQFLLNSLN